MVWSTIPGCAAADMQSGEQQLKLFTDSGANPGAEWRRCAGGEATRKIFACAAHVDCPVRLRLVVADGNGKGDLVTMLQRQEGGVHAARIQEYDRSNARLSKKQKATFGEAGRYGGTPRQVMANTQVSAQLVSEMCVDAATDAMCACVLCGRHALSTAVASACVL
jgi:hypothetical protein